jgi:hypothetical protein
LSASVLSLCRRGYSRLLVLHTVLLSWNSFHTCLSHQLASTTDCCCIIGIINWYPSASALLLLGIGIAFTRHRHCSRLALASLSLDIFIPGCSVTHPSASASPSLLVSASSLPRYWHPTFSTPPSSVSVSLTLWHRRYQALVSISSLRSPSSNSASASSSTGFVSSLHPYNQYHRYSYTPTNLLIETHNHSLRNRALYSYTAVLVHICGNEAVSIGNDDSREVSRRIGES